MKNNKTSKFLMNIIVTVMMIVTIGQTAVYAARKAESKTLTISRTRWVKNSGGEYQEKGAYALNNGSTHPIFQIVSIGENSQKTGTNYVCLNATRGATWTSNSVGQTVEYDISYDLVSDKSEIANLTEAYSNVAGEYYTQIMWILDNILLGTDFDVDTILAKAGIVYGNTGGNDNREPIIAYYYDQTINPSSVFSKTDTVLFRQLYGNTYGNPVGYSYVDVNGKQQHVKLSKELIEAVEQAVVWYFTNYKTLNNEEYNCYTNAGVKIDEKKYVDEYGNEEDAVGPKYWLRYAEDPKATSINWKLLANNTETGENGETVNTGAMLQEQAAILYNYLVDEANKQAAAGYTSQTKGTLTLEYAGTNADEKMVKEGSNYKIGPLKVATTGNTTIDGLMVTTGTSTTTLSGVTVQNESGSTIAKPTVGQNFYVVVPQSSINGSATIKVTGTTTAVEKKLRIKAVTNDSDAEQAIAEVTPTKDDVDDNITVTPEKQFDLALRKIIVGVTDNTGKTVSLRNEANPTLDATRTVTADGNTIPNTATYKHRKDPIVVSTGDTVKYEIRVYNEGEIDGYATKIVDQLPTGLKSKLKTGDTITTKNNKNIYTVNYDESTNKLELTMTTKTEPIVAYNGTTLASDVMEVEATVEQQAEKDGKTKHYLTNIAYIAEEYDNAGNKVDADRDGNESKPTESPNKTASELNSTDANSYNGKNGNPSVITTGTNNDYYFEGEQDDDDFEKVVVLPKEFDLKLMKFISAINDKESSRKITVDTTNLDNGTKTTADYQVSKVPLTVKTGDYVKYTFRIYNEGDVDGYASEISEDIPEGLEYDASVNTNPTWTVSSDGKTITTDALSKANSIANINVPADYTKEKYPYYKGDSNLILAYDADTMKDGPDYVEVSVKLKVTSTNTKNIIRNEAAITEDTDADGKPIDDRDSDTEKWKKENSDDNYENDSNYPKYEEDDEDYDNIKLATFDLALRKFISKISTNGDFSNATTYSREPQVDTTKLKAGIEDTAIYNHSKEPIYLNVGDYVLYTIRVYNEGDLDGYASEIVDYLPEYLDFVEGENPDITPINSQWTKDSTGKKLTTTIDRLLKAFDAVKDDGKGSGLSYVDVKIVCKVNKNAPSNKNLTNIAEITEYKDEDGKVVNPDRDSTANNLKYPEDSSTYKDDELDKAYVPGQEDDDDFEKVIVRAPGKYDIILIKEDETGEQLNEKATFEVNGETKEVTGYLVVEDDVEINGQNVNNPDKYIIKETIPPDEYCEFDGTIEITANKKVSEDNKSYELDKFDYKVTDSNGNDISDTKDAKVYLKDGNIYVEVIDYEKKDFDLALRKFITNISGKEVTSRIPQVSYKDGKITYTHPKDVVKVVVGDTVTYTLRVFNEGEIAGYAEKITDDIPEYLEFLPENKTNRDYRWVMYDKDGKTTTKVSEAVKIVTDYTSKAYGETLMEKQDVKENPNLLKAFDKTAKISDTNPDYVDVKVAFKVKDPKSNKIVVTNKAQISEDADENGNPVDDIDSIPDKWNDGEDDQDYENVSVEYFDLSLLKYVTKAIVTENGKTKTTKTGNTGSDKDITPKVEIYRKSVNSTIVKFEYTIKVTNEGDIAGYAKEITDYVPSGLKFYSEDNKGWKDEGNNVISTKLLKDTLLQPGQSATVKVILRWVNGQNNLGLKTNVAEISKDYNDKGVPDRDSTPDNKKPGEDDIDDASVLLTISTGILENTITYVAGALAVLVVIGLGVVAIKKYVL